MAMISVRRKLKSIYRKKGWIARVKGYRNVCPIHMWVKPAGVGESWSVARDWRWLQHILFHADKGP